MCRLRWCGLGVGPVLQGFYDFFHTHETRAFDQHTGAVRHGLVYRLRQSACVSAVLRLATRLLESLDGPLA